MIYELDRFTKAQDAFHSYDNALGEIRAGVKANHWIWYVFPQVTGLGHSEMARTFGIRCLLEARAYLDDSVLGTRLRDCTGAMLSHEGKKAEDILGGIDALKFRSCMTLFDIVCPDDIFARALDAFFDGKRCGYTVEMMSFEKTFYARPDAFKRNGLKVSQDAYFDCRSSQAHAVPIERRIGDFLTLLVRRSSMAGLVSYYLYHAGCTADSCARVCDTLATYMRHLLSAAIGEDADKEDTAGWPFMDREVLRMVEEHDDPMKAAGAFDGIIAMMRKNPDDIGIMNTFMEKSSFQNR